MNDPGIRTSSAGVPTVELRIWGVPRAVPAMRRMPTGPRALRSLPGVRFAKLLGTGTSRTFTLTSADLGHWAALTVWHDAESARAAENASVFEQWRESSTEEMRITMRPLRSKGQWSRRDPFGENDSDLDWAGPVAALTRARLRPTRMASFWRAVPPVAAELHHSPGNRLALGIGELPVGVQGTFSIWDSARALTDFAYRTPAHLSAVRRTAPEKWYAEELFARLAVTDVTGTYRGRTA